MVTKRDRNFLIEIFNQYISEGTELEWLNSLLYSGEDDEVIDELKQNGAEGILVVPIEKMVL